MPILMNQKRISVYQVLFLCTGYQAMDKGCNTKPLQKEVDHHLDLDESRL